MKKLLLISLLTIPAAYAMAQQYNDPYATHRDPRLANEGEQPGWTEKIITEFVGKMAQTFPALNLKSEDAQEKFSAIVQNLKELVESTFQNLQSPLLKIQANAITIAELRGLVNALNAYANNRMGLPHLAPSLNDIYNAVKDAYKKLVTTDTDIISIEKGSTSATVIGKVNDYKLADAFLQALIYSIVQGKSLDELLPLITKSLEIRTTPITPVEHFKTTSTIPVGPEIGK